MATSRMIGNRTGKVVGRIVEEDHQITYFAQNGAMAGRYVKSTDSTLDSHGRYFGKGDQGMAALNEYNTSH